MITFEIDGVEYTAEINGLPAANAVVFRTPDGTVLWLHQPQPVTP